MENTELRLFFQKCWHRKAFKTQNDESVMMYAILLDCTLICYSEQLCAAVDRCPFELQFRDRKKDSERLRW